uniref:Uncharacterized protein n=1 Tax=Anguilla anguilla TaxID=7936 RepID=A0A0E9WJX3_ANGAN
MSASYFWIQFSIPDSTLFRFFLRVISTSRFLVIKFLSCVHSWLISCCIFARRPSEVFLYDRFWFSTSCSILNVKSSDIFSLWSMELFSLRMTSFFLKVSASLSLVAATTSSSSVETTSMLLRCLRESSSMY